MTLAAVVLAAGKAQRFGGGKLAALFHGEPLLAHALRIACAAPVERVVVVTREALPCALPDPRITVVTLASDSLAASLRAGLAAVEDASAAFVFLGDMPLVPPDLAATLAAQLGDHLAVVPEWQGRPGHPVLLVRAGFALANDLTGDEGLGRLLRARDNVLRVPVADEGAVRDVDTPEALAELAMRGGGAI